MGRAQPSSATIVWFRLDLRLEDNPALLAAAADEGPVVPVFIWSPEDESGWEPGAASNWWLHQSLVRLHESLVALGSTLTIRRGPPPTVLAELAAECGARRVVWNRRYEPRIIERDAKVKQTLRERGLKVDSFNGSLLHEPWTIQTQQQTPYRVFTPFYKACLRVDDPGESQAAPKSLRAPFAWPKGLQPGELGLEPRIDWAKGIRSRWKPGERGALERLESFAGHAAGGYSTDRDRPAIEGTSLLSPHLHFGEIGPRRVWQTLQVRAELEPAADGVQAFLRQLIWREFAHHLLYHYPHTTDQPLREEFARFQWSADAEALSAWQYGATGYPIVDAGMRELWQTGWMHNRVRLITASFLVKDLLVPWQEGARWFWDTLVDADLANNTMGWQWVAGSGADAAPFFRIFNPVTQGTRFDPGGDYVRRWVPKLDRLPSRWIHQPWKAPAGVLDNGGVRLGRTYPGPWVDHADARRSALAAYDVIKKGI